MIISRLKGGLGNQMFQYAFGKKIAKEHDKELLLDTTFYEKKYGNETPRRYKLNGFNIDENIPKPIMLYKQGVGSPKTKIGYYMQKLLIGGILRRKNNVLIVNEKNFKKERLKSHLQNKTIYLDGYWQNPRYFEDIKKELRNDFTLDNQDLKAYEGMLNNIQNSQSILLQVRRGDYVNNKAVKGHHGVIGKKFYKRAIESIIDKFDSPHFFVTSDGIDWCKENIEPLCKDFPVRYLTDVKTSEHAEMFMMAKCKHFVIGNSTYGWWPAWLSNDHSKTVIAPKQWFANEAANKKCRIKPDSWIEM